MESRTSAGRSSAVVSQLSSQAICSAVLGSLGLALLGPLPATPGVICGHRALARIREEPDLHRRRNLALAGLVLSYLGILGTVVLVVLIFTGILRP